MKQHIKDYYASPALDQTKLKLLLGNDPRKFLEPPVIDIQSTKLGSLVDCLVTDPVEFETDYYVTQLEVLPTDAVKSIISTYYDVIKEFPLLDNDTTLLKVITDANYYNNLKPETKLAKVLETGSEYLNDLKACGDRIIITQADLTLAQTMVSNLQSTFPEILMNTNPDIEIKYQVSIYEAIRGIACKGLIDILIINHSEKKVKIIDLKTFYGHPLEFSSAVHSHRYDIQLAFYKELYELSSEYLLDYQIECYCLVSSSTYPEIPVLIQLTDELLKIGAVGRDAFTISASYCPELYIKMNEIEGFRDLLEKYKFYQEHGFDKDQRIVLNNSRFSMNWSGIV